VPEVRTHSERFTSAHEPKVLILTSPSEVHAFAVREVLKRKGVETHLWHTSDFPILQVGSLWLGDRHACEALGPELEIRESQATSVWIRRPASPVIPEQLEPADREFSFRESTLFLRSLQVEVGSGAFWVNPPESQRRANLKTEQLKAALDAGFTVPSTLCSNDPARIREFINKNKNGTIYKSFFPVSWRTADGVATLFSSVVEEEDLPEDSILRASPGIFQELVAKAYELRVTVIGSRLFTAKFRSQEVPEGQVDWRAAFDRLPMEPANLPESVAEACRQIMASLGLVFGCFDLIVTPAGDYVFLEVNEMGAFLWVEEKLEEIPLLDAFCEFLIQGTIDFRWKQSAENILWRDVVDDTMRQFKIEAPKTHIRVTTESILDEAAERRDVATDAS
jgi:glutathione synthase/RimK-type ligase-like ATP-grasp enzyme